MLATRLPGVQQPPGRGRLPPGIPGMKWLSALFS